MRINVYAEEITFENKFVTKIVDGRRFYGIRTYLKSPQDLHHTKDDDDRSAITFWVPWTKLLGNNHNFMCQFMESLLGVAMAAKRDDGNLSR